MKKTILYIIMFCLLITGCSNKDDKNEKPKDYSNYPFIGVWTREAEADTETIRFLEDGFFGYSCACGNPVNDSDICESYSYDEETDEIKLECYEETPQTITTIKLVKCDGNTLELDFDGEIRVFNKTK